MRNLSFSSGGIWLGVCVLFSFLSSRAFGIYIFKKSYCVCAVIKDTEEILEMKLQLEDCCV